MQDKPEKSLFVERENFRPFEYPMAFQFAKAQNDHHWTHGQIEVDSDLMQYNTEFTDSEKHGINTVLKLFTLYEVQVADYWVDTIYRWFPKPEVRMLAQVFAAMEAEHALFYDKLNTGLGLDTEEFYTSYKKNKYMKKRADWIKDQLHVSRLELDINSLLKSIATFSLVEGVVLYSSFAFLLSFQRPPKNLLKNVSTGISYSVRDEALHADAGSWLFNTLREEQNIDLETIEKDIYKTTKQVVELEFNIIEDIFSKGAIKGITANQLENFVKSRANKKLKDIGLKAIYEVSYNPISSWFYKSINAIEMTDFFDRNPTSYNNNWNFNKIQSW